MLDVSKEASQVQALCSPASLMALSGHTEHQEVLNFLFSPTSAPQCAAPSACNNLQDIPYLGNPSLSSRVKPQ